MLNKIDHIGIAVKSVREVKELFKSLFNLNPDFEEDVDDQKVKVIGFKVGESNLEFIEPLNAKSPISNFLEKRGEGLHHIAISVDNIENILGEFKSHQLKLIDEKPRTGAEGKKIAFVHPNSFNGILLELTQEPE
ncbi:MAG: methylmalonyl-CoA epimerase [Calditrichota bacterium]